MSRPCGVSTDSGWNWTPSTGSSRWRTAITSPSGAVAEISKHVGHGRRRERVVAPGEEVLGQPGEDAAAVVRDDRRLAVHELARLADLAAEDLHDRLVAEADAERRARAERDARGSRASRLRPRAGPGPGEMTRWEGASDSASSAVISSLRRTTTSAPSSPNRCARL